MTDKPPAGWYRDSDGIVRWWDGSVWIETLPSSQGSSAIMPVPLIEQPYIPRSEGKTHKAEAKAHRSWFKK